MFVIGRGDGEFQVNMRRLVSTSLYRDAAGKLQVPPDIPMLRETKFRSQNSWMKDYSVGIVILILNTYQQQVV